MSPHTIRNLAPGIVILVALTLTTTPTEAAPPPQSPLTLAAALSLARQNSRLMAAARLRIDEAEGDLVTASILLRDNPEIAIEAGPTFPGPTGGGLRPEIAIGIEQRLEIGGQRGRRVERSRAEVEAARADADDTVRVIDLALAQAFYEALASDVRVQLLLESERLAGELAKVASERLAAGAGTPLEVGTARIRLAEASRRTLVARAKRGAASLRLSQIMGLAPTKSLQLEGELPDSEPPLDVDALVARTLAEHPSLRAAHRRLEASEAAVQLADSEAWPDLGVGLTYGRSDGEDTVTAGLRMPLPFFDRNQGERQRTRSTRERIAAEEEALRLSIEAEIRGALLQYNNSLAALEIYDDGVVGAQREILELLHRALSAGDVAIADVIVVQREVVEGRQGYLDARLALALARANALAAANYPQTETLQGGTP